MNRSLRLLKPHVGSQRSVFGVAGLSTVLLTAAELARPFPLALVVDRLLARNGAAGPFELREGDPLLLAVIAGLVLLIAGVEALASYQMEMRLRRAGENVSHGLRVAVYAHLQRLSLSFHESRQHGDLVTRATGDVHAVGTLFSESLGAVVSSALLLVGMLIVSVVIDPVLALAAFSVAPILAVASFHFRRRVKAAARTQRTKEGEIASLATEALAAMREIKALGSEGYERERLARKSEERHEAGVQAARIESRFAGMADLLGAVGAAVVLVVGVLRVAAGAVSPGDLIVMASYARRIHRPLRDLARQAGRITRAMARADRIAEILATDEVLAERHDAFGGGRARGRVELDVVSFAYDPERPVLRRCSLRIAPGERLALMGPSGAGKSTVAALLARFYDPSSGRVLIDGRDLRDCSLAWLRAQVGLVLQDTVLFTGTVSENIAYGTTVEPREIVRAAKAAGAHAFIADLPDGYDTRLGPRGVALSGGQRQRIAIARTLLRDPPVLVLDEPTAALDAASEAEVLERLRALLPGRTTIIITHSPALAGWADRVVTLEAGTVVHDGSPERPAAPRPTSAGPRPTSAAPRDTALPEIARLLAPGEMAPILGRSLRAPSADPGVRVSYLRYKPGTNLVVQYEVTVGSERHAATAMIASRDFLERRAAKPENRALARLVDGRSPSATPLVYDAEARCLIQWYPLDLALPALAEPPARLCERLRSGGVPIPGGEHTPARLAYKPRRRAVLRLGHHVVKCYSRDAQFAAAANALEQTGRLSSVVVPRFAGALPSLRITAQSLLPGRPANEPARVASGAGEVLAALHATPRTNLDGLVPVLPGQQLEAAAASARLVVAVVPALERGVQRLLCALEESTPQAGELVPSHGDFNARQLLVVAGELAVTDFDELCLAPRALDLATYAAYVLRDEVTELEAAERVLAELVFGYGGRPEALSWYLATMLLRRAPRPFRYLEPDWAARVAGVVDTAEEAMQA